MRKGLFAHEFSSFALMPQQDNGSQKQNVDQFESAESPLVSDAQIQMMLDGVDWGSKENPQLVREPGDEAAGCVGRKLVEVRRNDAPGALHADLHQERPDRKLRKPLRKCP